MNWLAILVLGCQILGAGLACAEDLPSPDVRLEGDRLSVNAHAMPLASILESINRSAGVVIALQGEPTGIAVSDSFRDTDVRQALQRLLSQHSHVLIDHGSANSPRRIEVILLGRPGRPTRNPVGPDKTPAIATELSDQPAEFLVATALSAAPSAERAAAAEAIAYRGGDAGGTPAYSDSVLAQMLSDPVEDVRAGALETLKDTADHLPFDALAQVAREDPSPERRIQALELLVERAENGEALEPLRIALNDSEPTVNERARDLVLDWHVDLDGG